MVTRDQVQAWVDAGESEILEFKRSTGLRREATQTLCGMLNTRGGRVVFGIDPSGSICGQQVGDRTIEDVASELRELEPPVFPSIERVPLGDAREVLVVTVDRGQSAPHVYRGVAFRRVGNTTVRMHREEHNRMLVDRLHSEHRWENEPIQGWSVDDLDAAEITRTLDEAIRRGRQSDPGTRHPLDVLRGLGLTRGDLPLRAAAVLFGRDDVIETRMPQCLLRLARFRGLDKAEFIDNRQYHGNAFRLLALADRFVRDHLPIAGRVVPGLFERADDPLYPPVALREALANAVCHRDYSIGGGSISVAIFDDRLEITSSGELHFGLSVEDLFRDHESLPWNPLIAGVFYRRGIIERWGRGTLLMAELSSQAGLPRPQIEQSGGCVLVRFRPGRYVPPERVSTPLSPPQRELLALLESGGGMALRDLRAGQPARTPAAIKTDLARLKDLGLVSTRGHGRGAFWYRSDDKRSVVE